MGWCQWVYDKVRASAAAKGVELPGFQQFWAEGFVELPPPERDFVLFEDFRRDPEAHPLKTPSGRIEIVSDTVAGFDYADCPPHPAWLPPVEWLGSAHGRAISDAPGDASARDAAAQPAGSGAGVARAEGGGARGGPHQSGRRGQARHRRRPCRARVQQ